MLAIIIIILQNYNNDINLTRTASPLTTAVLRTNGEVDKRLTAPWHAAAAQDSTPFNIMPCFLSLCTYRGFPRGHYLAE
jgi:hypothetical protein